MYYVQTNAKAKPMVQDLFFICAQGQELQQLSIFMMEKNALHPSFLTVLYNLLRKPSLNLY